MIEITSDKTKPKAREAMLVMAKEWQDKNKIQHAIEGYEAVIEATPQSKEADRAKDALMEIARGFEQKGKKYSAFHLYHKLAQGRVGSHDSI